MIVEAFSFLVCGGLVLS